MSTKNKLNILFISNRIPHKGTGPYYSMRNQSFFMSKINNVMWYNLNDSTDKYWEETKIYYNTNNFPSKKISELPIPFNNPDLVVFQGFYEYRFEKIIKEVKKRKIPYIIVPRSSLTKQAQKQRGLKKKVANFFIFNKFAKYALAIQYLTNQEKLDSGRKWNKESFVIPNGITPPAAVKKNFNKDRLRGLYIGRLDMNHKGLDLLIESVNINKDVFEKMEHEIHLYGPDSINTPINIIKNLINKYELENIIKLKGPVYGIEKEKILLNYDYFIMTSRFEGHPMGLIEALSYGLPVFITRGTNMYDEVKKYKAGWVCETDIESISKNFIEMTNDIGNFEAKSKDAIELSNKYLWSEVTNEMEKSIKELW